MYKKIILILITIITTRIGSAQDLSSFFNQADNFFSTYVNDGRVDYKSLIANSSALDEVLKTSKAIRVTKEKELEYQSFWINAYNLLVIKSVVANYPIKSPLDKAGFFDGIKHDVGGKELTLNEIEHEMLRGVFTNEARYHFVLVCAGLGCPPIISKAYLPSTLDAQLQEQTILAINDESFIQVNKNKVKISQIFEWYKGDFTKNGKSLVDYINQYKTEKLSEKSKVSYYPYDWRLNEL